VPQKYAPAIQIGAKAIVSVPEYPGRTFPAIVDASARSVDAGSGTTHMQLVVENADRALMPGGYANVLLDLAGAVGSFRIPVSALIFDSSGLRVATLDSEDHVAFKMVTVARDLGTEIEIGTGLNAADRVIAAPPDGLAAGDPVRIVGVGAKAVASVEERATAVEGK
jgi:membrane fusion protein (multidrug efflux system)